MGMQYEHAFQRLEEIDRKLVVIGHIMAVLDWDSQLWVPLKESDERGKEMAYLARAVHDLATSNEVGDLLGVLGASSSNPSGSGRDDYEKAIIRLRYTDWDKGRKVSSDLVGRLSSATSRGYAVWADARSHKDWKRFAPVLEEILSLKKEKAELTRKPGLSLYDAMLDDFEPGMTTDEVDRLFGQVRPVCEDIVKNAPKADDSFLMGTFDRSKQEALQKEVMKRMGFDFTRGLMGISAHPFTSALGVDDVRITTRYTDPSVMDSFFSVVHETGHALYEQWASGGRQKGTSISNGASYAWHESQSRLWENIIGRSRPFLSHVYPLWQKTFPSVFGELPFDTFYRGVNKVQASFIRTNADEVSYNLHIILRYEMEKKLVSGELGVDDVPEAWNELSRQLLGIVPPDDALGCLQDVHWASGEIGYFPTYALGNLYGAQVWDTLNRQLDSEKLLATGEWAPVTRWLGEHVWSFGMTYTPSVLIRKVSGSELDASYFTKYLETKYKEGLSA